MEDAVRSPLEPLLARARQVLTQFYLPPTLRRTEESLDGLPPRLTLDSLISRLHTHEDSSARNTYFITGAPGGGKTTLTQQVQARLLTDAEPCPCALLDLSRLQSLENVPTEVKELVIALRPNEVHEEHWWKKQAKKGRVVLIVDAWNEIVRWAEGKHERARLLRALLFGNHRFNVVVTSRDDLGDEEGLRTPERLLIEPLSGDETEAFLVHGGLDPAEGKRAIQASGLELAEASSRRRYVVVSLPAWPQLHRLQQQRPGSATSSGRMLITHPAPPRYAASRPRARSMKTPFVFSSTRLFRLRHATPSAPIGTSALRSSQPCYKHVQPLRLWV